jgi:hypothetical protein
MDLGMRPKGAGGGAGWCSSGSSVRGIRFACSESLLPSSSHLFCECIMYMNFAALHQAIFCWILSSKKAVSCPIARLKMVRR